MKRWVLNFFALIALAIATVSPNASLMAQQPAPKRSEQTKEETVYITRTGKRYHREDCRYLSRSKFPMTLKDAKRRGYTACKVCHPPQ